MSRYFFFIVGSQIADSAPFLYRVALRSRSAALRKIRDIYARDARGNSVGIVLLLLFILKFCNSSTNILFL